MSQSPILLLREKQLLREGSYINGKWQSIDASGCKIAVKNPATGEVIANVANCTAEKTREAIEAAHSQFAYWSGLTAKERSSKLRKLYDLMIENKDDLARIITAEMGKPFAESLAEVLYAANFIEWNAEEGKRVYGDVIPTHRLDCRLVVLKQPIGVVAAITPWNFPLAMITRKIGPALAVGCSVVVKPSVKAPLSALALATLAEKSGIPNGVLNVVVGESPPIGRELCSNKLVKKMTVTGSTSVGKGILKSCADDVKKVSLELGGNAVFIVFEDADIDAAVENCILCKFRNSGQTCVCANRIYVHCNVYDTFSSKLCQKVKAMKVGPGDKGVDIGPLVDSNAVTKCRQHVDDAIQKGGCILAENSSVIDGNEEGSFFPPTVIGGATHDMKLASEETFGPVAPLFKFVKEEEVLAYANDTEYGLAGYFFTRDSGRVWRVAERLECGIVGVNTGIISTESAPFGGLKESGLGREGGKHGIDDYLEIKYVCYGGI